MAPVAMRGVLVPSRHRASRAGRFVPPPLELDRAASPGPVSAADQL